MNTTNLILGAVLVATSACSSANNSEPSVPESGSLGRSVDAVPPVAGAVQAAPVKERGVASHKLRTAQYYYDGKQKRVVFASDDLIAEFQPTEQSAQRFRAVAQDCEQLSSLQQGVRLWRVRRAGAMRSILGELAQQADAGRFAPVFHDGDTASAPKRSLPGGVIVTLDASWDRARVEQWAASEGVTIEKELSSGKNTFVVKTAPGQQALALANRLFESGKVESASPNWWREANHR